jgi:T5SS/PEP-CTERM-associated repeat protein
MLTLEHGQRRIEPDWFPVADAPNTFAEVTIRDPGSLWRVNNWLALGDRGRATVSISDGGTLSVGNFLELAEQGGGTITVRSGGHLRTENWTGVAAAEISTRLDGGVGAVLLTGAGSNWTSVNHVTHGANGGTATLDIEDGATMLAQNWLTAGEGPRSRGTVTLSGGGRVRTNESASLGNNGGTGSARVTGASSWSVGGQF